MRKWRSRCGHALVVVATLAALAACSAEQPAAPTAPALTPSPSSSPLFATDEEALAAAKEVYAEYLKVSDAVSRDGGDRAGRLRAVTSERLFAAELESYEEFAKTDRRLVGESSFDTATLQERSVTDGVTLVSVYLCVDLSETDIVDDTGASVSPRERLLRYPLLVKLAEERSRRLTVDGVQPWAGVNFC